MSKLIFGCGYLGERVARQWHEAGDEVIVVTRSATRANELAGQGYRALVADVTKPETIGELPTCETVLFAVGYDGSAGTSIEQVYAVGIRNVLHRLPDDTGSFIYISSTGVYGDAAGGWVDEQTAPNPQRPGGRASLAAELTLAASRLTQRSIILRLAGIYGPGRIPYLDKLRRGEPIAAPSAGWVNLIHVDDATSAVLAAESYAAGVGAVSGPQRFCICDGTPAVRCEFYREVARQIGADEPKFTTPASDSPAAARAAADKRISNEKMLRLLGIRLDYPSYVKGLAAVL